MVAEAVQQRGGQLLIGEHADPLAESEIGGDDGRASFIAIGDQIEQQLAAGAVEGDKPEFVDDQKVDPTQPQLETTEFAVIPGFQELSDQIGRFHEQHPEAPLGSFDAQSDGQMISYRLSTSIVDYPGPMRRALRTVSGTVNRSATKALACWTPIGFPSRSRST